MGDVQEYFQVEDIVGKSLVEGIERYRIRWKNYPPEEDTYEREDYCIDCHHLIIRFEITMYRRYERYNPEIIGVKLYQNKVKLLIKWQNRREKHYFYSEVVRRSNPMMLINFYENYISNSQQEPPLNFLENVEEIGDVYSKDVPESIIAFGRKSKERIYLVVWKDRDEATISTDSWIKKTCPHLLIDFFEKHIHKNQGKILTNLP